MLLMRNLFLLCSACLLILVGSAFAENGCDGSSGCSDEKGGAGFHWYDDTEKPEAQSTPQYPSYQELWDMHPDKFAPLLEDRKKLAIQYPTEENVYRYLEIQDVAKRKSIAFAAVMTLVGQKHPEFSSENKYPLNVPGQKARNKEKNRWIDEYLFEIKKDYALLVFTQEGCGLCKAQIPILDLFMNRYGIEIKYLDINEYGGLADRYSISLTPSILVISRQNEKAMPIASGVISLSELRNRLVRSVRYMKGEIKPEQFYTTPGSNDPLKFVSDKEADGEK